MGVARGLWEETGIRLPEATLQQVAVFGEPGRIASYPDGSVWRMVVILYRAGLDREPRLRISAESKELRFFTRQELETLPVICTHGDMVGRF